MAGWEPARGLFLRLELLVEDFDCRVLPGFSEVIRRQLAEFLLREVALDAWGHLVESHLLRRHALGDLDDVVAELRGHDVADLVRLEPKRGGLELGHHLAAGEGVFAPVILGAGIVGVFLGEFGKIFTGPGALEQVVGNFPLGLFLLVINALMILLVDYLVAGFLVDGFWWALLFSIVLSIVNSIFHKL